MSRMTPPGSRICQWRDVILTTASGFRTAPLAIQPANVAPIASEMASFKAPGWRL